jgi:tRNA(Ser,Leu) C12 N-acetylase TAN1
MNLDNINKAVKMLASNIKEKKAFYDICKNYSVPLISKLILEFK